MKLIIFLLLTLLTFTVSGALIKCDDNSATPIIQVGGISPTTLADGSSAIDSFNNLKICIDQLTGTGSNNTITKLTIISSLDLTENVSYLRIAISSKFAISSASFELEATFTNNAMDMDHFYQYFMQPFEEQDTSLNKITFSSDQEISWETFRVLKIYALQNQLGASTFNYLTQTYSAITDMNQFQDLVKEINTDAIFDACVKEWAVYSEVTLKTVNPLDFTTCANLLNQQEGFLTKLTIDLEGATGLNMSQIEIMAIFTQVYSNLVEIDMNIKSCQIQQTPFITQDNFTNLRKLKLNISNNDYNILHQSNLQSQIQQMTEIELLEFELIFQETDDDSNYFRDFTGLFDIMKDYTATGSNMDSYKRILRLYDGFNLCTYNEKGETDCDIFKINSVNVSNHTPMNCQGETVTVNADGLFTHNGIDLSVETEYTIEVSYEYFTWDITNPDQFLTLDMYQVNSGRTFTVNYSTIPIVYKGTGTNKKLIPFFTNYSSQTIEVYECAPRAQLLANGVSVQNGDVIEACTDYEFTLGEISLNGFNSVTIDSNTEFSWVSNRSSYTGVNEQSLAVKVGSLSSFITISAEIQNPTIYIPEIRLEVNQCTSTSSILINGATPNVTYTPCADLNLSLGDIIGDAVQNPDSIIRWYVSGDDIPIQGTFYADEPTFTIPSSVLEAEKTFKIINQHFNPTITTNDIEFTVVAGTCQPPAVETTEFSTVLQLSIALLLVLSTIL